MSKKDYFFEQLRLRRAVATAEYRDCKHNPEKLQCLLYRFAIKPHVIVQEKLFTRGQVYYFLKKNGVVRWRAGRPRILEGEELKVVKQEIRTRSAMKKPVTRYELIDLVRFT